MQKDDNRNMLLAIVLSGVVLLGWNYFYGMPQAEKQRQQAQTSAPATNATPGASAPGATAPGASAPPVAPGTSVAPGGGLAESRDGAMARGPRISVDTARIFGSISLLGGRIDDVSLKAYRETVDPRSAHIVLLSPANSPKPYYADFGWVSATGVATPTASTLWSADSTALTPDKPVTLRWDNGQGLMFSRVISVDQNAMFTVKDSVENKGATSTSLLPYGLVARHGKPVTLGFYVLHEGLIGVLGETGLQEYTYDSVDKEPLLSTTTRGRSWKDNSGGFVGITDKYWATAIIPDQERRFEGRLTSAQTGTAPGATRIYQADMLGEEQMIAPGATGTSTTRFFAGAKEVAAIDGYQEKLGIKRFDRLIDWGWFYFITKPMFQAMNWIFHLVGNFGLAILIITILIKIVFLPLANKSYASMAKMKAVQPEMLAIRERHADDKLKQQQAMMELYKKEKINPLAGCWPVLIQIPVFFALYKVLFVTIEMRHAPFYGWIRDLAAPDPTSLFNLFGLLPFTVPEFLHIGVWPILMGITMFVQMKMNPEPPDPVQKAVFTWMPLFFTFLLASFPAGLVIYWTWNNLLSVIQQGYIMKKHGTKIELWDNLKGLFAKKADAGGKG